MPKIQTRLNKVGNVIKYESHRSESLARVEADVTYAKGDSSQMEVGQVLQKSGATFIELADTAHGSKELAILIDDRIEELVALDKALESPTGIVKVALLVGKLAPCIVRQGGLDYGLVGTTTTIADVNAALESLNKIRVEEVYSTKY